MLPNSNDKANITLKSEPNKDITIKLQIFNTSREYTCKNPQQKIWSNWIYQQYQD